MAEPRVPRLEPPFFAADRTGLKAWSKSRQENRIMRETAIVSGAPGDLHGGVRVSTTPEGGSLLEQLRAAYQGLGREEQSQVKSLLMTLSGSNSHLLCRKETNRSGTYGKQPVLERCSARFTYGAARGHHLRHSTQE